MTAPAKSGWVRLSRHLTMRDVAAMVGFHDEDGKIRVSDVRRARRMLARLERQTGRRLLFDVQSGTAWTTLKALREAAPDLVESERSLGDRVAALEDDMLTMDHRTRNLRAVAASNQRRIKALEAHEG